MKILLLGATLIASSMMINMAMAEQLAPVVLLADGTGTTPNDSANSMPQNEPANPTTMPQNEPANPTTMPQPAADPSMNTNVGTDMVNTDQLQNPTTDNVAVENPSQNVNQPMNPTNDTNQPQSAGDNTSTY